MKKNVKWWSKKLKRAAGRPRHFVWMFRKGGRETVFLAKQSRNSADWIFWSTMPAFISPSPRFCFRRKTGTKCSPSIKGQFLCAQRAAREMAKNKWGRIINIASVASGQTGIGIAGGAHYTESKGGIIGMSETLAIEWAPLGITVNVIGPGAIDTPMVGAAQIPKAAFDAMISRIPLNRMGRPEEISATVVFLAYDEASCVPAAPFFVDGGGLAA